MESGVLESYRTLGLICDHKPFKLHREGDNTLLTFPLGKSYLTYTLESLKIRYIGPQLDQTVNSVDSYKDLIFVSTGNTVSAFHKIKQVKLFTGSASSILEIFVFSSYLLGLNFSGELKIWDCDSTELLNTVPLGHKGVHIIHPPTHLNKVLISLKKGKILLVNIKTGNKIYDFPNICKEINGEITALENAVALDTIVVGLDTGKIILANIMTDQVLFSFDAGEKVSSLSVSSYGDCNILASGLTGGLIILWDLKEKKIQAKVKGHPGFEVTKVMFMPNELRFVSSSGGENSLKQWVFDFENPSPRVNKSREGFNKNPFSIQFYNENHVLALSSNSLKDLSLLNEHQSSGFSSKNIKPALKKTYVSFKLPSFNSFSFAVNREKDWCNIITNNEDDAFLWSYENKAIGDKPIQKNTKGKISAVGTSECGNYGVIGTTEGILEKFNMQSGLHQFSLNKQHNSKVIGIEVDSTNSVCISASSEGEVFISDFFTGKIKFFRNLSQNIVKIKLQKSSNLLAVLTETNCFIFDIRTLKLARSFEGSSVVDCSFSSDSRWIGICDSTGIKIWDLPNIKLIDWVSFKNKAVGLDFSPDGRYLATVHERSLGVFLWLNKTFYTQVIINKSPTEPRVIKGFDVTRSKNFYSKKHIKISELTASPIESRAEAIVNLQFPKEISHETLSLSSIPYSRISALCHLDEIKERNAPIEPPKKPQKAPFFLPDSLGVFKYEPEKPKIEEIKTNENEKDLTGFLELSHDSILEFLKTLSPSRIELNIYGLTTKDEIDKFLAFLAEMIEKQKDYDFLQSVLACFLRIHSKELTKNQLELFLQTQQRAWSEFEETLLFNITALERLLD